MFKFTLALILFLIVLPIGCATNPISPATQQQITQKVSTLQVKGAVAVQNAKNTVAVNAVYAASPVSHPIAATNTTVSQLHGPLLAITLISFAAWAIVLGLSYTSFGSFLSPILPALRLIAIVSVVSLFTLPWMPLAIVAVLAAVLGLFVYEIIHDKGNVKLAIADEESDLGFSSTTSTSASTSASSTTPRTNSSRTNGSSGVTTVSSVTTSFKAI
jgi:hypothetical protein